MNMSVTTSTVDSGYQAYMPDGTTTELYYVPHSEMSLIARVKD